MEIDVTGPDGNVFVILGVFKKLKRELEKAGGDVSEYDKLLNNYTNMSYDEILDEIERISNGSIRFVGR